MSYTLHRTCKHCGTTFTVELEPGREWPNYCGVYCRDADGADGAGLVHDDDACGS